MIIEPFPEFDPRGMIKLGGVPLADAMFVLLGNSSLYVLVSEASIDTAAYGDIVTGAVTFVSRAKLARTLCLMLLFEAEIYYRIKENGDVELLTRAMRITLPNKNIVISDMVQDSIDQSDGEEYRFESCWAGEFIGDRLADYLRTHVEIEREGVVEDVRCAVRDEFLSKLHDYAYNEIRD